MQVTKTNYNKNNKLFQHLLNISFQNFQYVCYNHTFHLNSATCTELAKVKYKVQYTNHKLEIPQHQTAWNYSESCLVVGVD